MKNVEKVSERLQKSSSPGLASPLYHCPVAIYIHCDEYLDSPW